MKITLAKALFLGIALNFSAVAKTTLKIPVMIEGKKGPIPAAEINKKLKRDEKLPEYIELSEGDDASKKMKTLNSEVEKALKSIGGELEKTGSLQTENYPGENNKGKYKTCYIGNPLEVSAVAGSLADVYYSDQLNIWGYKYKKTTHIENEDEGTAKFLNKNSKLWRTWTGKTDAVLLLSAIGDDGDDIEESIIERCEE